MEKNSHMQIYYIVTELRRNNIYGNLYLQKYIVYKIKNLNLRNMIRTTSDFTNKLLNPNK